MSIPVPLMGFGGKQGGIEMKLLWENASTNSTFDEQTIPFDWNGCAYYCVEYHLYQDTAICGMSDIAAVGNSVRMFFLAAGSSGVSGSYRDFTSSTKNLVSLHALRTEAQVTRKPVSRREFTELRGFPYEIRSKSIRG